MLDLDKAMTLTGVGLATSIAAFAALAVARNDGVPRIGGQEHLALFGQPSQARDERIVRAGTAASTGDRSPASASIDYAPTATIPSNTIFEARVLRRDGGRLRIAGLDGPVDVRLGDEVAGMGRLTGLRQAAGQWIAVFERRAGDLQSSR